MNKELEEMQSALNKLEFYIWDIKETTNFEKQANKQIEILQKGLDNLKSSPERNEKLEKVWSIFNTNHITYEHKELIKKANSYNEYVDLYHFSFKITDLHEHLVEEDEWNLLKELL